MARLSTKDLATLAQRIIANIQSDKYPVIANHPLTTAIMTSYADYDKVYTKQTYSGKGKDIAAADHARDVAFSSLKGFLGAYRKLTSAANYQLAADLYDIFKSFGLDLDSISYSSQTAQMKKLVEALEEPANNLKLKTLSLQDAFIDMKTKHEAFETLFTEQAEANADLRNMTSATAIRRDLENNLRTYLNLLTAMKGVPGWELLYTDTDELVKAARESDIKPKVEKPLPQQ